MTKATYFTFIIIVSTNVHIWAQGDSLINERQNTVQRMSAKESKLTIGGYAQIDYNQELGTQTNFNGNMDVHRLVLLFGYKFNTRTSFFTEIELEHVSEVFVEQAFLNHKINNWLHFRAGLMLLPMGIINEYHEPPTYNGVERPNVDKYIVPTTWREIGLGFSGRFDEYSLKYQLYVTNGFLGFDGNAKFDGKNGLRGGRQKGAKSVFSTPNFTARIDYFGVPGLKLGVSGYFGKSQSTAFNGLHKDDNNTKKSADSTVIGISMIGADAQYSIHGFGIKAQYNLSNHSNTLAYNQFTDSDLGSSTYGFYVETYYNILQTFNTEHELIPFVRYENYNTQATVESGIVINEAYAREEYIFGMGWKMHKGAILKMDYQILNEGSNKQRSFLNMGVGVMF